MNHQITYFTGAGASAQALPMVSGLYDRLQDFSAYVKQTINGSRGSDFPADELLQFIDDQIDPIILQIGHHSSFDTLAKKLFISDGTRDLFLLKGILNIYLEFEEAGIQGASDDYRVQVAKDLRYDSFLATFLIPTSIKLPEDIKVITWNYDNQWEKSYRDFAKCSMATARKNLRIYSFVESQNAQIIKLNGWGGALIGTSEEHELVPGSGIILNYDRILLDQILYLFYAMRATHLKPSSTIKFAWEISQDAIVDRAKEILQGTHVLVISGYSFPEFNREVDNKLFYGTDFDKIYLQIPEEDYDNIRTRAEGVLRADCQKYIDVDRACIPRESFIPYAPQPSGEVHFG
jgi:hypothetical protein